MSNKRDYYEILGVPRNASKEDIRRAYREQALKYHPDRNKSPGAAERFKEISEAYAVLSDDEKRKQYDQIGYEGIHGRYGYEDIFRGVDFDSIFRDFGFGDFDSIFEMFFGAQRRRGPRKGADRRYDVFVTLEDVASGLKKRVEVPGFDVCGVCGGSGAKPGAGPKACPACNGTGEVRHSRRFGFTSITEIETCKTCRGKGTLVENLCTECGGNGVIKRLHTIELKIPAGIKDGQSLRLGGYGEPGVNGGPRGDLYVVVHVEPHRLFKRRGDDILYEARIGFPEAALGAKIKVPTLSSEVELKIPAGTQSGTVFRLKGKGVPHLNSWGRGDQLVKVLVQTPTNLTKRQRKLIEELARDMKRGPF
ncbi:MAG: molecular chaperone DnaJ [Candidatus Geothermarchaeales archaeon]